MVGLNLFNSNPLTHPNIELTTRALHPVQVTKKVTLIDPFIKNPVSIKYDLLMVTKIIHHLNMRLKTMLFNKRPELLLVLSSCICA